MKDNHTPGPWIDLEYRIDVDVCGGLSGICELSDWMGEEEMKANATLIASAPELLEALVYARRFLEQSVADVEYIDTIIAKAKGE